MSELQGMEEFDTNMDKLGARMADKLEAAVMAGAWLVRNEAQLKASFITGNLKRSLHIGGHGELENTTGTDIGGEEKSNEQCIVHVGTNVEYAAIQEFGGLVEAKKAPYLKFQSPKGVWHSVKSVQIPPHPYLRPAFDENKERAQEEIRLALKDIVENI